jgi:hypothetical protein
MKLFSMLKTLEIHGSALCDAPVSFYQGHITTA